MEKHNNNALKNKVYSWDSELWEAIIQYEMIAGTEIQD